MNARQAKYPQLRFKCFTDPWEQRKLGDMADFNPKSVLPETFEYVDLESVVGTDIISHRLEHKDNAPSRAQRLAQKGDVFYQTVRPYQKNNCIFDKPDNNWVFSTGYAQLRPKKDSYFLLVSLQNNSFIRKVLDRCTGTSYPAINSKDLAQIEVVIPDSIGEQKKIGSLFHSIDKTITLHQRKLAKLKKLKQGYLQKLFPKNGSKFPQLRFAGFADAWEQRKLGETKTYFTDGNYGESYPSSQDMSDKENGVPFLRGSDFSNGYLDASNANYISKEKHAVLTSGHIENDDIVLSVRGSLGTLGYATKYNEGWNINSQLAILRTNKNELLGVFLIQYLLGSSGQKEILSRNTGTALKQLPIKQLKDIPVPIPIIEEQEKIGSFFKQLDNTIDLHQRKLEKLQELKKGYLQKMFC